MNNPTKLLPTDLIAVEVPKTAESIVNIEWGKLLYFEAPSQFPKQKEIDLGFDFEILGEVTEDSISETLKDFLKYEWSWCDKEFRSLLQTIGLNWVNEIEKPDFNKFANGANSMRYQGLFKQWQEAESKLIKGKLIILKQIK